MRIAKILALLATALMLCQCRVRPDSSESAEAANSKNYELSTRVFFSQNIDKAKSDHIYFGFQIACLKENGKRHVVINTDKGIDTYDTIKKGTRNFFIKNSQQVVPKDCVLGRDVTLYFSAWNNGNFGNTMLLKEKEVKFKIAQEPTTFEDEKFIETNIQFVPYDFKAEQGVSLTFGLSCNILCLEIPESMRPQN